MVSDMATHVLKQSAVWDSSVTRMVEQMNRQNRAQLAPVLDSVIRAAGLWDAQRAMFARAFPPELFRDLAQRMRGQLPANLREIDLDWDELPPLLLEEGLPIAWVPRAALVERVFAAPTSSARRAVYGKAWAQILDDCDAVLEGCSAAELVQYVTYARKVVAGIREGHHEIAQAMTANLFDSVLRHVFEKKSATRVQYQDPDEDLQPLDFLLHCSIRSCYYSYNPDPGIPIPTRFGRHPSAHAVSPRQYTRINSVLAVAHLAGVLRTLDKKLSRGATARIAA